MGRRFVYQPEIDMNRRDARSRREAGQRRSDIAYRAVSMPPGVFAAARGTRSEARETMRVGVWEAEGGSLPLEVAAPPCPAEPGDIPPPRF